MKQPPKNQFVHPSMAAGQQQGAGARKGVSRLVPGAKVGDITQGLPPGLSGGQRPTESKPEKDQTDHRRRRKEQASEAAEAAAAAREIDALEERPLPEGPLPGAPVVSPKIMDRRHDVINKLLTFKQPAVRKFTVSGMTFTIKVLSPAETMAATRLYETFPNDKKTVLAGRALMFAASLMDIDGVALEDHSGSDDSDPVVRRFYELMQWQLPILDTVLEAREKIMEEVRREYTPDFLTPGK